MLHDTLMANNNSNKGDNNNNHNNNNVAAPQHGHKRHHKLVREVTVCVMSSEAEPTRPTVMKT